MARGVPSFLVSILAWGGAATVDGYRAATREATAAVADRVGDIVVCGYLLTTLLLSILIYVPRLVYEVPKGCSMAGWAWLW